MNERLFFEFSDKKETVGIVQQSCRLPEAERRGPQQQQFVGKKQNVAERPARAEKAAAAYLSLTGEGRLLDVSPLLRMHRPFNVDPLICHFINQCPIGNPLDFGGRGANQIKAAAKSRMALVIQNVSMSARVVASTSTILLSTCRT